jgi:uncharacterized MAPEG superfamily protein
MDAGSLQAAYGAALAGWVALGVIVTVQFVVADVTGIRRKHVPGMPIGGGHDDFLFRATRTLANTSENLPLFVLLSAAAILLGAAPRWTTIGVWTFVAARAAFTVCYWADWRLARSTMFGVGQLGQLVLLVAGLRALA